MDNTDLLLLHGALGSKSQLYPLADILAESFTIHLIDFEGHGEAPGARAFSIEHFAENVISYLDAHLLGSVDIFGYSMGGYVATYLARVMPKRVGSIFTLGTKWEWSPEIAARETRLLDAGKIAEKVPQFAEQLRQRHTAIGWERVLENTAAMMRGLGHDNRLKQDDFAQVGQRVRVGVGDRDTTVSVEESAVVYRMLPNAELQVLPGTPHPFEKIDPRSMARHAREFFGKGDI